MLPFSSADVATSDADVAIPSEAAKLRLLSSSSSHSMITLIPAARQREMFFAASGSTDSLMAIMPSRVRSVWLAEMRVRLLYVVSFDAIAITR